MSRSPNGPARRKQGHIQIVKPEQPRAEAARGGTKRLPTWRLVLLLLSLAGFWAFSCPLFGGILNVANVAAMTGFLTLAAIFLFWPRFLGLLGWFWARRWGRVLVLFVGIGSSAVVLTLAVLFCLVATRLHAVPQSACPTVIVLGCQVKGQTPSLLLSFRIEAATDYLNANPASVAILSGGCGSGENITEAECMYRALTERGIDPARLYLEDSSRNTRENLQFSKELMAREGLRGPVAIVSNDFHIYRALRLAEDAGLDAQGLAARSNWYSRPTYMLREAMALVQYAFTK